MRTERRVDEAIELLRQAGLAKRSLNRRTALTMLAMLDLTPSKDWTEANNPLRGTTQLMRFFAEHYGQNYQPNTRETVRDESVAPLVEGGLAVSNPDNPDRPKTSPYYAYQVHPVILEYVRQFGTPKWKDVSEAFSEEVERLRVTRRAATQQDLLHVFLCHTKRDKATVRELYDNLSASRVQPWLDEVDLLPGQDWQAEIRKAMRSVDVVLVCLSKASVDKEGFVQAEIGYALDRAKEQPERAIFIIPVKLEACQVPDRLIDYQYVELYAPDGYGRLMRSLKQRAATLGRKGPK